ncbi:Serine/threonine-protein kinase PrkC [Polystyrenella longa]|uniref:non-specific serine/threonine protein kinase n=1 Tax=Polystyrenella longa TaxID=2528007 RepID=A0A518CPP6_9PLAN|nr:protein kinase [Polystyrenella longa]QDU81188.1 Serine/threonine-protein kinase PrkC [Polystyrenella longa]
MDEQLDEFESAWRSGAAPPNLVDYLPDKGSNEFRVVLSELIKIDIDYRWRVTSPNNNITNIRTTEDVACPRLEHYFSAFPELGEISKCPHELIAHEYRVRKWVGDAPVAEEYMERFSISQVAFSELIGPEEQRVSDPVGTKIVEMDPETTVLQANPTVSPNSKYSTGGIDFKNQTSGDVSQPVVLADYEILKEIARGGMGVVYKAKQRKANRLVALKMILSGNLAGQEEIDRFKAEAEAAANLDHPNIVPIYDVGEANGYHYFSMAFVDGPSLSDVIREQPMEPLLASKLMVQVAEALEYAHQNNIIHRDLKPANIMLDADGSPRVTDFGLAKRIEGDSNLTATGQIMGTPSYMPPEQALGNINEITPASDVYSMGAIFYHLLTGRVPFRAASMIETLDQVVKQEPASVRSLNPAIDLDLDTIILKTLRKKTADRYSSAKDFGEDIQRYLEHRPIKARRTSTLGRVWRWSKRNRLAASFLAAVLFAIISTITMTSYASIVYREMASAEKKLRTEMSENLYLSEMNLADDVLERSELQEATSDTLMRWSPKNPYYFKKVSDSTIDWREWEWFFLLGVVDRYRIAIPGRCLSVDINKNSLLGFGFDKNFAAIKFRQEKGGVTWAAHEAYTSVVKFSPDEKVIATGGVDGKVGIWDIQSRRNLQNLLHDAAVGSISFNDTGNLLVTHAEDAIIRIWNWETGTILETINENVSKNPACSVSPNGKLIAVGSRIDDSFPVNIWNIETGNLVSTLFDNAHSQPVQSISWSPHGQELVSGSSDSTVRVWNVQNQKLKHLLKQHHQPVYAVAWSGDGKTIASAGDDMELILSDAMTGEQTAVYGHRGGEAESVKSIAWGPNSKKLVAAIKSGKLDIIDFEKSRPIRSIALKPMVVQTNVATLSWLPDHNQLGITYGDNGTIWKSDTNTKEKQKETQLCWSHNNELAASIHEGKLLIRKSGEIVSHSDLDQIPRRLLWNPSSNLLAIQFRQSVQIWREQSKDSPTEFVKFDPEINGELDAISWNSDGTRLVIGSSKGDLQVYRIDNGEREAFFLLGRKGHQVVRVRTIAWKPNSTLFAIGTSHNYLFLFDYNIFPRQQGGKIEDAGIYAHDSHVNAISWSPNGKRLASASADRTVRIWNFDTDRLSGISNKRTLTLPHASEVRDVLWHEDGHQLASLTDRGIVTIFDARPGYQKNEYMTKNPGTVNWSKPGY